MQRQARAHSVAVRPGVAGEDDEPRGVDSIPKLRYLVFQNRLGSVPNDAALSARLMYTGTVAAKCVAKGELEMKGRSIASVARLTAGCAVVGLAVWAVAIALGQQDDFQDGTTQGWGGGANPTNVPDGGPNGQGDRFLQITSRGGFGEGSRLATFNLAQWTGDYQAAGVDGIRVHMRNQSNQTLSMRVVLFGPLGSRFTSRNAILLPPDNTWHEVTFSLREADLLNVFGPETYAQVITNVTRLMFRHDADPPGEGGDPIAAQMGIDNITAIALTQTVLPTAFTVTRGELTGGGLNDLHFSDDSYVNVEARRQTEIAAASVEIEVVGTSPIATPSELKFIAEAAQSGDPVIQRIELFNYASGTWETVDERNAPFADTTVVVTISSNAERFVHQGSREVKARIGYHDRGVTFPAWGGRYDMTKWEVR